MSEKGKEDQNGTLSAPPKEAENPNNAETTNEKWDRVVDDAVKFRKMQKASQSKTRKHMWMSCLLSNEIDFDALTPDEQRDILKKTKWQDRFTDNEYRYLFQPTTLSGISNVKSRLKNKVRDWLMVMSILWYFDRELFNKALKEGKALYEEQSGRPFAWTIPEEKE